MLLRFRCRSSSVKDRAGVSGWGNDGGRGREWPVHAQQWVHMTVPVGGCGRGWVEVSAREGRCASGMRLAGLGGGWCVFAKCLRHVLTTIRHWCLQIPCSSSDPAEGEMVHPAALQSSPGCEGEPGDGNVRRPELFGVIAHRAEVPMLTSWARG